MTLRPLGLALALSLVSTYSIGFVADASAAPPKKAAPAKKAPAKKAPAPAKKPVAPPVVKLDACTNFYQYANQDWFKANPLGSDVASFSSLSLLKRNAEAQQANLLNAFMTSPQGPVQKALGDFWASGLDQASIEADGANPIAGLLSRVNAMKSTKDVAASAAALHQVGLPVLFNFAADLDLQDLNRNIGYFTQGGIGLPDAAIYSNNSPEIAQLMKGYRDYVGKMLLLSGTPQNKVAEETAAVLEIEKQLATVSKTSDALDVLQTQYAAVKTKGLNRVYPNLQLEDFLKAQGVKDDIVSISDDAFFKKLNALIPSRTVEQWRAYLRWRIADSMSPYLSKPWRDANFDFRGRILQGRANQGTRAEQTLAAINSAAGSMLGREYASRYLSAETKRNAENIAASVRSALIDSITRNTQMSANAKTVALAKASKIGIEVGYPRRDLDYSIQPMGRGSFGGNILIASTWQHAQEMKRIGKGNSDRRWDVLPQNPVVAYEPEQNRLIVTAAALQSPIYSTSGTAGTLYGSYAAMVGHELSRGFDLDGRMLDQNRRINNWWSPEDSARYDALGRAVAAQYNNRVYSANPAARVDPAHVINVAMADQTGVELALAAFNKAYPNQAAAQHQDFFRAWAALWAQNMSPTVALIDSRESAYAPGEWRTNVPLMNAPEFATAFSCPASAPMVAPAATRVDIWP